jgi:hypothetical protein
MAQMKAHAAGSLTRTHLAPPFPVPEAVFTASAISNPSPSFVSPEGQIKIKISLGFDLSSIFSPGTTNVTAMFNAMGDAASPACSAPTPAMPAELKAPITPDPQLAYVLIEGGIADQAQIAHPSGDLFPQSFFSLAPVQPHWDPNVLQQGPLAGLQTQTQQWTDLWGGPKEVTSCDVLLLLWSFWTVSVRLGAFAQYDFLYGLIYQIFLVFLGLFPVGFGLFG